MKKIIMLFIGSLFLNSCVSTDRQPFSPALQNVIDSFIMNHPSGNVIILNVSQIEEHSFLFIQNSDGYSQEAMDGYWHYKSKLITYYQTDSVDRSSIVNLKMLEKYDGPIEGYNDVYEVRTIFEPSGELFLIKDNDTFINLDDEKAPELSFKSITQNNVITNKSINEELNKYIEKSRSVLYEVRFYLHSGKQYVSFRGMDYYDKDIYDGFFYRDGYPIVLYGIHQFSNILNVDSIERPEGGIPNRKHHTLRDRFKSYPFPKMYEIRKNGDLKPDVEDAFIIIHEK